MRLITAAAAAFIIAIAFALSGLASGTVAEQTVAASQQELGIHARDGRAIFRFDTFGDEQLWTDVLRMHEVIPTVDPMTALAVGLKVDVEALPAALIAALRAGAGRSDRSRRDRRAAAPERRRRREGVGERRGPAHDVRHHLRLVPLVGRRLASRPASADAWTAGRTSTSNVGSDRRALAGAGRSDEGRVQDVGTGQVRSAAPCVRRHGTSFRSTARRCRS